MQPLLVRRLPDGDGHYEIVAGERRWRAAQLAGCHELPVVVYALSDREALEVALLENVQRQDLTPLEEADGYRRIDEFGHTQEELARTLGKSRSHIANLIRLLGLPPSVRTMLERGEPQVTPEPCSARRTPRRWPVRWSPEDSMCGRPKRWSATSGKASGPAPRARGTPTRLLLSDLSMRLGLPVRLQPRRNGGTLSIAYRSAEQLDDLIKKLT